TVDSLEYKMHRILMMKTAFFPIGAQHAISHYFFDLRQIPADKVYRMAQSPIQPFKRIFQRPALLQEPAMICMIVRFDRDQLPDKPSFVVRPLPLHGFKEPAALT